MICGCWVALIRGRYVYLSRTNKEMFQYAQGKYEILHLKGPEKSLLPVEDGQVVIGNMTETSATIPELQSKSVSTLVWTDPDSGLSFRPQGGRWIRRR